jgi:regulator of protease activity HflC (stomatin/prohibitin superfamily)
MAEETIHERTPTRSRWGAIRRRSLDIVVGALTVLLLLIFFWPHMVVTVLPGHAGVVWRPFGGGTDVEQVYGEGMHLIPPWARFYLYDVRMQETSMKFEVVAQNALHVGMDVSIRYRPAGAPFAGQILRRNALGELHRMVGPEYLKKLVIPEVSSVLLEAASEYDPEALYKGRPEIESHVMREAGLRLKSRFVELDGFNIKHIMLPDDVREAIENKLVEAQNAERYKYTLLKEQQEAERKRIEAEGIRMYQSIISEGLTEAYLRHQGIKATLELATSPNAKTVVVGGGANGLPLILNEGAGANPAGAPKR